MATSGNRDVNLVIRAKNEASAGIKSVADALKQLEAVQDGVAAGSGKVGAELGKLQTNLAGIAGKLSQSAEAANAAISRQAQGLVGTNQEIAAKTARVEELRRALGQLQAVSDKKFVGPTVFGSQTDVSKQITAVKRDLKSAESDLATLSSNFDRQLAGFRQSKSLLQEIKGDQAKVADAIDTVTAAVASQTQAFKQNSAEAQRAQAAQNRFSQIGATPATGLSASDPGRVSVLLAGDQAFAAKEAADIRDAAIAHKLFEERVRAGAAAIKAEEQAAAEAATELQKLQDASDRQNATAAHAAFEQAARKGAQAMRESEQAAEQEARAFADIQHELNPSIAIYDRLNQKLAILRKAQADGRITADQLADAEKRLAANAKRAADTVGDGKVLLFGLKPYELQNLSFQINDIFTQLASGASLTQTLAQQGGQLLQIFPKVGSALISAFTDKYVLAGIAAIASLTALLKSAADEAERLRSAQGLLAGIANGGQFNAQGIADADKALQHFGLSAANAKQVLLEFTKDGVDPGRLGAFINTARNLSDVMGVDLKQSATEVSQAFTGGYVEIKKLDDSYNVLTATEREYIRTLFEEGKASEARAFAIDKVSAKLQDAADKQRGPWSEAVRSLTSAYHNLFDALGNTVVAQALLAGFQRLANIAERIAHSLNEAANNAKIIAATNVANKAADDLAAAQKSGDPKRIATAKQARDQAFGNLLALHGNPQSLNSGGDPRNPKGSTPAQRDAADTLATLKLETELQRLREKGDQGLTQAEQRRRIFLAGQAAFNQEILSSGDKQLAQAKKQIALDKERSDIRKSQQTATSKEREQVKRQQAFDASIEAEAKQRKAKAAALVDESGKTGDELVKAQRDKAIADAIAEKQKQADEGHFTFTQPQKDVVAEGAAAEFDSKRLQAQEKFNRAVEAEAAARETSADALQKELGLTGQALINAQREKAVQDAIAAKQKQADENLLKLTDGEKARIRASVEKEFEAAHATDRLTAQRNAVDQPVDTLTGARDALQERIGQLNDLGQTGLANSLMPQLEVVNAQLQQAIANAQAFYSSLNPTQQKQLFGDNAQAQIDAIQTKLATAAIQGQRFGFVMGIAKTQIAQTFAGSALNAVDHFAQRVAEGGNAFKALGAAFLEFAATFFREIAQMILQQLFFNAISGLLGAAAAPAGAAGFTNGVSNAAGNIGASSVTMVHSGGVIGRTVGSGSKVVSDAWFANAARYHTGGIAGLRPDELPAILQRGEEVITRDDPRHRDNGGLDGAGGGGVKIVNAFDSADMLQHALNTTPGQRAFINFVRANSRAMQAALK